jgi:methylated-DNA-[protein]-cysteine S-methyltransferase
MKQSIVTYHFKSPIGELILGDFNSNLCLCDWRYRSKRELVDKRLQFNLNADFEQGFTPIHQKTIEQLDEYFSGNRMVFEIPLLLVGTDFQKKVWESLQQIEYGKLLSYLQLSKNLGDEKAIRAVASANGANSISIIIPCHRVIASSGDLQGYAGGLLAKKRLLELEGSSNQMSFQL